MLLKIENDFSGLFENDGTTGFWAHKFTFSNI